MRKATTEFESPNEQKPVRNRETIRKDRVPIGGDRLKMAVLNWPFPDYRGYWFNDSGARIQMAIQAGYDFVTMEEVGYQVESNGVDSRVRQVVGKGEDGRPLYAYLMRIHKDFVQEDEAAREARRKGSEHDMRRGKVEGNDGAFYTPGGQNIIKS